MAPALLPANIAWLHLAIGFVIILPYFALFCPIFCLNFAYILPIFCPIFEGGSSSPSCKYCLAAPCHRLCHHTALHHKACPQVHSSSNWGVHLKYILCFLLDLKTISNGNTYFTKGNLFSIYSPQTVAKNLQFGFIFCINLNEIETIF